MSKHDSLPDNDLNLSRTVEAQGDSVEMKAEPEIRSLSDGRSLDTTHKEVALAKEAKKKVQAEARLVEAQTKLQVRQDNGNVNQFPLSSLDNILGHVIVGSERLLFDVEGLARE